jgi:hypothetical protein
MSDLDANAGGSWRESHARATLDDATRRLVLIAGGVLMALVLLVGGWAMMARRSAQIPVIEADSRPLRVKPENPGGMQAIGTDESASDAASAGRLAPAAETPAPQALRAQLAPNQPLLASAPPIVPLVPATSAPQAEGAEAPSQAARPAPRPAAAGKMQVQIASVSSEAVAQAEWKRLSGRLGGLLADRQPTVVRTEVNGKIFYRLRTGGFNDVADATAFCEKVRAKGTACALAF